MTDPSLLHQVDELVTRSHSDGLTDLTAAALIEQHGRFLLVHAVLPDLDTPRTWRLPSGPVLPGETVPDGLHRILAQSFGYSDAEITGFLGIIDADDSGTRTFVFAVSTGQPDSICRSGHLPHRWIDNITVSDLIPRINPLLHTYYATTPG
ncbi:MAG: NUDIX hydrolase [Streptomyces sp.]